MEREPFPPAGNGRAVPYMEREPFSLEALPVDLTRGWTAPELSIRTEKRILQEQIQALTCRRTDM